MIWHVILRWYIHLPWQMNRGCNYLTYHWSYSNYRCQLMYLNINLFTLLSVYQLIIIYISFYLSINTYLSINHLFTYLSCLLILHWWFDHEWIMNLYQFSLLQAATGHDFMISLPWWFHNRGKLGGGGRRKEELGGGMVQEAGVIS